MQMVGRAVDRHLVRYAVEGEFSAADSVADTTDGSSHIRGVLLVILKRSILHIVSLNTSIKVEMPKIDCMEPFQF